MTVVSMTPSTLLALACLSLLVFASATGEEGKVKASNTILATRWTCSGWFCDYLQLDIISMDLDSKAVTVEAHLTPVLEWGIGNNINVTSAIDNDNGRYFVVLQNETMAQMFTFTMQGSVLTQTPISREIQGKSLTNIGYDSKTKGLYANYGMSLVGINVTSGLVKHLAQLWKDPSWAAGPAAYDGANRLYSAVTINDSDNCWYIVTVDMTSMKLTKSDCILQAITNPFNDMDAVALSGYNSTHLLALLANDLGPNVLLVGYQDNYNNYTVFSFLDFVGEDWSIVGEIGSNVYDPLLGSYLVEVTDSNNENYIASVTIPEGAAHSFAIPTATIDGFQIPAHSK